MSIVFDFHTHALPLGGSKQGQLPDLVATFRKRTRSWSRPFSSALHGMQLLSRLIPEGARQKIDHFGTFVPFASLLVESSIEDLQEEMRAAGVDQALLIAHPPYISNEFVLDAVAAHPNLFAAVNIPVGTDEPAKRLREYVKRGARVLKIHTAADGEGVNSPRYRALLDTAAELKLPVVLHTGCAHSHLFGKGASSMSRAEVFRPWFKHYSEIRFILAHMNYHEPNVALELAEDFANVSVDTSWQPVEIIGEAVRRAGAERVLFGTDWPIMGNNLAIGRARIDACVDKGAFSPAERDLILGGNALRILGLPGGSNGA